MNNLKEILESLFVVRGYKTESKIEHTLLYQFVFCGLRPETQYEIGRCRIDIAFPEIKLAIECDGAEFHQDKEKDDMRDAYLETKGWKTIRFTGSEIYRNPANCVIAVIRTNQEYFKGKFLRDKLFEQRQDYAIRDEARENRKYRAVLELQYSQRSRELLDSGVHPDEIDSMIEEEYNDNY